MSVSRQLGVFATVDEALVAARSLCAAPDLPRRLVGAGLIAERLNPYGAELAEFVPIVERLAATDADPQVLVQALRALDYAGLERTLPTILPLASSDADAFETIAGPYGSHACSCSRIH